MKLAGLVEHQLLKPLGEGDKKRWLFVTNELEELLRGESDSSASDFDSGVELGDEGFDIGRGADSLGG